MATPNLTRKQVSDLLCYNQDTGIFTWQNCRSRKMPSGSIAGSTRADGYVRISIGDHAYLAHRLAWFLSHGRWPEQRIDHIDGNPSNNALRNLRDVSGQVNSQNVIRARTNSKSGLLGASFHARDKKWRASIRHGETWIHLGYFDTAEEAHKSYMEAKRSIHVGFPR